MPSALLPQCNTCVNMVLKVQAIIRSRTTVGQRHRDHANTGNVIKTDNQGALSKYFFGEKLDQKLSYQKFLKFHKDIQDEILWIEVGQYSYMGIHSDVYGYYYR